MDTLALQRPTFEKTATSLAGIGIAITLFVTQITYISAKDIGLENYTGLSPTLNFIKNSKEIQEKLEANFESEINKKYANYKITTVEKGIKHVQMVRYYNHRPVRINIVELSSEVNDNLAVEPSIASAGKNLSSRSSISNIARRSHALVAINGGYFKPQTGVPLGTLMINKELYTGPIYDRVGMGFSDNGYTMARIKLNTTVDTNIGGIKVDNINQPRMLATHTLVYTPSWGEFSPASPKYGLQIVVEDNKIINITTSNCKIPKNGFVIVGAKQNLDKITRAKKIKLNINLNPEWKNVNHIISGGPYLVKDGEVFIDMTAQKLGSIGGRNPRTAIGFTKDNHLIMLTADGREGSSIGLTLTELAYIMKQYGCVNAMNLDGGGSTVMYIKGQIVNRPVNKGGIPLSHTLNVYHKNFS